MLINARYFDYFGFIPQFRFLGESKFKSTFGGIIFISYGLFAIYYFVSQFVVFLKNIDNVDTSWNLIKNSQSYNLTTKELYFGVGFLDSGYNEYNLSSFPYYNITLRTLRILNNGTRIDNIIPLETCDLDLLIDKNTQNLYSNEKLEDLKNRTKYYLCPNKNFSIVLSPINLSGEKIFLLFYFSFTNSSIISQADNQITKIRPRATLINKNILINSQNKTHPFTPFIDYLWSDIDSIVSKKMEFFLNPFEMLDDDNIMGDRKFQYFLSNYSTQKSGTIFKTSMKTNQFAIYENRSLDLNNNKNLDFFRFQFNLNSELNVIMRSYKKFSSFLAEVSSILSILLLILTTIITRYNSIQGKNNIIKIFLSNDSINNLKFIKGELDSILKKNSDLSNKKKILSKKPISNEMNLMTCKLENEYQNETQIKKTNDLMKIRENDINSENL